MGNEILQCKFCKSENLERTTEEFAFLVTKKKDGTVVDRAFKGIMFAVQCLDCKEQFAVLDTPRDEKHWQSLKRWEEQ
jgi:hypothetical protein